MARVLGVLLTALALLVSGCGGGEAEQASGPTISFEELARSAQASADATSGRLSFAFELAGAGADEELGFSGEGAFDTAGERMWVSLDLSSFGALLGGLLAGLGGDAAPDLDDPAAWRLEAIRDGDETYVKFPALADKLPAGKTWIRADESGTGVTADLDLGELTQEDPRELLDVLREVSGDVETVGTETLRGVETTHFRVHVDPARYRADLSGDERGQLDSFVDQFLEDTGLDDIPVDVWVDDEGLVRKLLLAFSARRPGTDEKAEVSARFELWDYGEQIEIELPPADEIADASELED